MVMTEQQWYSGGWNARSDHAVSKPIMMVNSGANLAQSPRSLSMSHGEGAVPQMVALDVLNGSPASVNANKYLSSKEMSESDRLDDSKDGEPNPVSAPFAIPIPNANGGDVAGTPDFQFTPYLVQGGKVIGGPATGHLGSTPTGPTSYGYGSWNAVYTGGLPTAMIPGVSGENTNNIMQGVGCDAPPPPPMYSCSPPLATNLMGLANNFGALTIGGTGNNSNQNSARMEQVFMNNMPASNGYNMQHQQLLYMYNQATPPPASLGSSPNFFGSAFGGMSNMNNMNNMQMAGMNQGYNPSRGPSSMYNASSSNSTSSQFGGGMQSRRRNGDDRSVSRSTLLDEYRNNRAQLLQLSELGSHVVEFAKDQHGSRFIQQKLEKASPKEKQMVFDEVIAEAPHLMTDVFGNYVIQKFFEYGTEQQKRDLAKAVSGNVMKLAMQMYGCRVVQKALESIDEQLQIELLMEMDGQVLNCVKDQNGNHVVQKVIEKVQPEKLQFIIDAFLAHPSTVYELSTHPYGCRVIQRVLEHCSEYQKRPVLEALHRNMKKLVEDQYGNYVVQHVVEHGSTEDKDRIVEEILVDVLRFAKHKFASNVIEKCLTHADPKHKNQLISEVCGGLLDPSLPPLLEMMKDQYANYVVQKMLDVADSVHRRKMMFAIRPHIHTLRKYNYGKHIITKLEKYFQKHQGIGGPMMPPSPGPGMPPGMPQHLSYDISAHQHPLLQQNIPPHLL